MLGLLPGGVLGRMRPAETAALWQLYEQTNGENWTKNENWDLAKDPCRLFRVRRPHVGDRYDVASEVMAGDEWYEPTPWYGVSCSDPCDDYLDGDACYHGRATALRLRQNGLRGDLDWTRMGEMANLTHVDLAYNSIGGALPTELGLLNNAEFLQFSNSPLAGVLPTELGQINSHGPMTYGTHRGDRAGQGFVVQPRLREITVQDTSISGYLPSQLGVLTGLQYLDGARARLSGSIPTEIAGLTALQVLYLSEGSAGRGLSGSLPTLFGTNMSEVRYIQLNENRLRGPIPEAIGGMQKLTQLLLDRNELEGTIPTQIGLLTSLRSALTLNDNHISGTIPSEIGLLRALSILDLYANDLTGDPPATIANLINLRQFYVDQEQLTPLLIWFCRERLRPGKYNYRILRDEWERLSQATCANPYTFLEAFGTLDEIEEGDGAYR